MVSQDTYLFNGTIEENLSLAKPDASSTEIEEAVKAAHIYDFIHSLKDGYKTNIGERGLNFSGGQRQRIGNRKRYASGSRAEGHLRAY